MPYKSISTELPEVVILEPTVFEDDRGFFFESFNLRDFKSATGLERNFVQDNHSLSHEHVIRGLHYQIAHPQGKLVRVAFGEVFDVAVDLRRNSPTFGRFTSVMLSAANRRELWIPEGFAHGFLVTSAAAEVLYKATDYWYPAYERTVLWNDESIGIDWPISGVPVLGRKDGRGKSLTDSEVFA